MDALASFMAPDFRRDPYPFLKWLRENDPVHQTSKGFHLVSRHADAVAVQRLTGDVFRGPDPARLAQHLPSALEHPSIAFRLDAMLLKNPPEHTRLRRLVAQDFTPKRVSDLRGRITEMCDELLDAVEQPLRDGAVVDLHTKLATALTVQVISELVGVPRSAQDWLSPLVKDFVEALSGLSEEALNTADQNTKVLREYFQELIDERRRTPQQDLVSALVAMRSNEPDRLSDDEVISMLLTLWIAGFETTAAGIDHGVLAMINHPDQREWLHRDATKFVDEVLRYSGPALFTPVPRIATQPVELSGITLPAGSDVRPIFAAANRDPEAFEDPDRFDPSRDTSASLAFGYGIHRCLGSFLGSAEIGVALTRLHERFPNLALGGEPQWGTALPMHAPVVLPVALDR
jgi:cytochrome P450 family 114